MSEPRTAAGRTLWTTLVGMDVAGDEGPAAILAIEAEARAAALDEARAAVAALVDDPRPVTLPMALATIDALRETP